MLDARTGRSAGRANVPLLLSLAGLALLGLGGVLVVALPFLSRPAATTRPAPETGTPEAAGPQAAAEAAPRPDRAGCPWATAASCPSSCVAFLAARDLPALARRVQETELCKTALDAFQREGLPLLMQAQGAEAGTAAGSPNLLPAFEHFARVVNAVSGESALVLTELEIPPHYRPIPHLLLLLKPATLDAQGLTRLGEEAFDALAKDSPRLIRRDASYLGTEIRTLGDADVTFAYAASGGILMLASDEGTLREALECGAGKRPSLAEQPAFADLCRETRGQDTFCFMNARILWDNLPSEKLPPEASGLTGIDAIALGLEVQPPVFVERLALHTRGARAGFLSLFQGEPVARPLPNPPAHRVIAYSQARLAPAAAWDTVTGTLKKMLPAPEYNAFQEAVDTFNRTCGFRFREDFLHALGDSFTSITLTGEDLAKPDILNAFALKEPTALAACIEQMLGTLSHRGITPFTRQWIEGTEVFVIDPEAWNKGLPVPYPKEAYPIAFGIVGGQLVLSNRPELVARYPAMARADDAASAAFKASVEALNEKCWAVSYVDLRATLQTVIRQIPRPEGEPLPPFLTSFLDEGGPIPSVSGAYATPYSLVIENRSPLPLVTACLGGAAAALALPVLAQEFMGKPGEAPAEAAMPPPDAPRAAPAISAPRASAPKASEAPTAQEAEEIADLIEAFVKGNDEASVEAARKLCGYGPKAAAAAGALASGLADESSSVRRWAARALGAIGPAAAEEGVAPLIRMLGSEDAWDREAAAGGLGGIGPAAAEAFDRIHQLMMQETTARAKLPYATALGGLGAASLGAVPDLVAGFRQMMAEEPDNHGFATGFALALGGVGPEAAETAVPVLAPFATDDRYSRETLQALGKLGPLAVPVLAKAVRWQEPGRRNLPEHIRQDAAEALAGMGPEAAGAIPALLEEILDDEKGYVFAQQSAAQALGNIGDAAVPALKQARKHLYEVSQKSGLSVERTAVLRIVNESLARLKVTTFD